MGFEWGKMNGNCSGHKGHVLCLRFYSLAGMCLITINWWALECDEPNVSLCPTFSIIFHVMVELLKVGIRIYINGRDMCFIIHQLHHSLTNSIQAVCSYSNPIAESPLINMAQHICYLNMQLAAKAINIVKL